MSHDLLDDLLADVPRHIIVDSTAAWRAGTGRRRRRYAAEGLAVSIACVLVGIGLVQLDDRTPVQPTDKTVKVEGYPSTVGWPFGHPQLPDRPGAMAGVIAWSTDQQDAYSVVDSTGRSWELPDADDFAPTLSDDGRWLAYLRRSSDHDSEFVLRDLVTGNETEFPDLGHNRGDSPDPWLVFPDTASFWSPDDHMLVVRASRQTDSVVRNLLLSTSGRMTDLPFLGVPAGWQNNDRLVWVRQNGEVSTTDTTGQVSAQVQLAAPPGDGPLDGSAARVSPDGSRLATITADLDGAVQARIYSLTTGELEGSAAPYVSSTTDPGPPVWRGEGVLIANGRGLGDPTSGHDVVTLGHHWPTVTAERWAGDALVGPDRGGPPLLDWRYWWFLTWWPQALMAAGAVLLGWFIWWRSGRDLKGRTRRT